MSETKSKESQQKQNLIMIGGQYALKSCIYRGRVHNLYLAINKQQPGNYFIVRLFIYLIGQHKHRQHLRGGEAVKEIELTFMPTVLASGDVRLQNTNYYYQVFDKYGPSLKLCFQFANKNFTLGTICMIGIQLVMVTKHIGEDAQSIHSPSQLKAQEDIDYPRQK
ncbi:unnamed protein product [Paramecium octaurelia]|uniref:Uncharacterized protein n=1 Tax=Paramecium octaurelia TaxID=43137 RepID=A0A8S1V2B3_PAROT|nr:unnamed protein product [Paramecium octaurelia]